MDCHFINDHCSQSILSKISKLNLIAKNAGCDPVDLELVKLAISFAKHYHNGQFRKSGEPYYTHPIEVALLALDYRFSTEVACAAILHDVVEDTDCTYETITSNFGDRVAQIVYRLTRIRDGKKLSVSVLMNEALFNNDIDALVIKVCDRIHNMSTIEAITEEKQKKIAKETLEEVVAIASYIGDRLMEEKLINLSYSVIFANCPDVMKIRKQNLYEFSYDNYQLAPLDF